MIDRRILLLGAGGAARASVDALRSEATKIWVASRDLEEARAVGRDPSSPQAPPSALSRQFLPLSAKYVKKLANYVGRSLPLP